MTYYNRKKAGLCVKCGKQKENPERCMCRDCAEKDKTRQKETREFLKNMGLCPVCGKNKLFGDEKRCLECSAKSYESNRKSRQRRNITAMDYYRRDTERLKAEGICRGCRKQKVVEGHIYCAACLAKKRERGRIERAKKRNDGLARSERPNYGLCYTCGKPLDREGRVCQKCAERATNNLPTDRGGKNKYWRSQNQLIGGMKK
ncbi:MAG: hypothetical protein LUI12_05035 [Clostridiales bacterium]|nr:hypothetical protein [Clostridiales bacterium]